MPQRVLFLGKALVVLKMRGMLWQNQKGKVVLHRCVQSLRYKLVNESVKLVNKKDIVIDSSLAGFHNTGVRNFTLAHEIGHQLLHIYYPLLALSDQLEEDCADIIAEGLLLPECLVRASMAFFQFPDTLSHISRSQLDMNYPSFKKMARQLGVQRQLLANRMKYLHILTSDVPYRHTLSLMEAG